MYYQNNVWATEGVAARCNSSTDGATAAPVHCPLCERGPHKSAFSQWNPASYPSPTPGSLNGDGSLLYPGVDGPISTIRYENIRDGIDDAELFARCGYDKLQGRSRAADLIEQLIANGTARVENETCRLSPPLLRVAAR